MKRFSEKASWTLLCALTKAFDVEIVTVILLYGLGHVFNVLTCVQRLEIISSVSMTHSLLQAVQISEASWMALLGFEHAFRPLSRCKLPGCLTRYRSDLRFSQTGIDGARQDQAVAYSGSSLCPRMVDGP